MFLMRYHALLDAYRQATILEKYRMQSGRTREVPQHWADLWPYLKQFTTFNQTDAVLERICDPTASGKLAHRLRKVYLEPVGRRISGLPVDEHTSLLIYGPPGTRKTSLVKRMCETLSWPLLVLTPPDFLVYGMEGLERRAGEVFTDLGRLRGVIVFLDECEEFFKKRTHLGTAAEVRTMGAFVTSGMLPRLQALHDNHRVLLIAAMNSTPDALDPAVIRPGRFDYIQLVGYPALPAQIRHIKREIERKDADLSRKVKKRVFRVMKRALEHIDSSGSDQNEPRPVTFRQIEIEVGKALAECQKKVDEAALALRITHRLEVESLDRPPDLVSTKT